MLSSGLALSERRASRLVGLSRDAWRHLPQTDAFTHRLTARIIDIAHTRRRFGYRRVHDRTSLME